MTFQRINVDVSANTLSLPASGTIILSFPRHCTSSRMQVKIVTNHLPCGQEVTIDLETSATKQASAAGHASTKRLDSHTFGDAGVPPGGRTQRADHPR